MATTELTGAEEVAWDLGDLYEGPDDPRIESDITAAEADAAAFRERYHGKVGALDAAARVLASSKEPLNCKALIEAMAKKGLWTSPGGKTPHATLYSAIIREIALKGKESRFVKKERGQFATN